MKPALSSTIGLLLSTAILNAQSITVCPDGSCDFTELQPAIDSIPVGGSAEIHVSAGTYVDGGITFPGITVVIKGLEGPENTILTQSGSQRIMRIASGNDVSLRGLTIRDGVASTANDEGGGIRVANGASISLDNCIIRENTSIGDGAGVWVADGANAVVTDCEFIDNVITGPDGDGGGLYLGWIDGNTIDRCGFHRNIATGNGGGLFQARGNQSTALNTEFCQLRNSVFWANQASGLGGAAVVEPALADCEIPRVIGYVTNCTFFRNGAVYAGGIYGHDANWCGSPTSAEGLNIPVFNSILRKNYAISILDNQPTYYSCSINHLTFTEARDIMGNNLNPQLLGDSRDLEDNPPDTMDARLIAESFMIERGRLTYAGLLIDPGTEDYRGGAREFDDPNTDNLGPDLIDIGAVEFDTQDIEDLDDTLGIGLSIWTNAAGDNRFDEPLNWFNSTPPDFERGWIINDPEITVELPDSSGEAGPSVVGTLTSFRGTLNLVAPVGGASVFQVPKNDTLPFDSGIYLGLVYPSQLVINDAVTIECDVLETRRARIRLNGGKILVDGAVSLDSDQSDDPGPEGLRISTLHGPGIVERKEPDKNKAFDPVLINNGRIRVDDLLEIRGDYEQTGGTLKFRSRAGDSLPSLNRKVEVDGRARLGGTVVFDIGPGSWEPEIGSCFPLLTASEGFEAGYENFDFVVTRWASDSQNRFFVLSNEPCKEGLGGSGSEETVNGIVVSLESLQSQNETLQSAGVVLRDLLMFDVDEDGFEDMVLSIDTGSLDGQVVVLLNQGLDVANQWQGFQSFGSVTGVTVAPGPRGLDAGYFAQGKAPGVSRDIVVASQSGTVTLIRNLSLPGSANFSVMQAIDLVNGEADSDGVNPQPVTVCALNFDEDDCGLTDLAVGCLDNSVWTFQNTFDCNGGSQLLGTDPLENSNRDDDATEEPITKFVPGLGTGGGKRNDKPTSTSASKDGGSVESGSKSDGFTGVGFTLDFTRHPVLTGSELVDLAKGDLDGDGDEDVVVANRGDDSFGILLSTGLEAYEPVIIIELDQGYVETESVTLADVDGDSDLDIALICKNNLTEFRVARVIRNTLFEQGVLGWVFDSSEILVGQEPYLLRSSDVDGDGIGDLLALTEVSNFAGNGPDAFGFGVVGAAGASTCFGDLDGDANVGGSDLAILLGSWGTCSGACAADFDVDGSVGGSDLALLLGAWGSCDLTVD